MKNYHHLITEMLTELGFDISHNNAADGMLVIQKEAYGIKNMIVGVAEPILILEQFLFTITDQSEHVFKSLLQKNRDIIHGAFVLDESGTRVIFRDTLQIENLDRNELEASINSLSLLLSEYSAKIIEFSKY